MEFLGKLQNDYNATIKKNLIWLEKRTNYVLA